MDRLPSALNDLILEYLPVAQKQYIKDEFIVVMTDLSREQFECFIRRYPPHDLFLLNTSVRLGSSILLEKWDLPEAYIRKWFAPEHACELLNLLLRKLMNHFTLDALFSLFSSTSCITSLESYHWHKQMGFLPWNEPHQLTKPQVKQMVQNAIEYDNLSMLHYFFTHYTSVEYELKCVFASSERIFVWMMEHQVGTMQALLFLKTNRNFNFMVRSSAVVALLYPLVVELIKQDLGFIFSLWAKLVHSYKPLIVTKTDLNNKIHPPFWKSICKMHEYGMIKDCLEDLFVYMDIDAFVNYMLWDDPLQLTRWVSSQDIARVISTPHFRCLFHERLHKLPVDGLILLFQHGFPIEPATLIRCKQEGIGKFFRACNYPITQQILYGCEKHAIEICEVYVERYPRGFPFIFHRPNLIQWIKNSMTLPIKLALQNPEFVLVYDELLLMCKLSHVFVGIIPVDVFLKTMKVYRTDFMHLLEAYKLWYPNGSGLSLYHTMENMTELHTFRECSKFILWHFFDDVKDIPKLQTMFQSQWRVLEFRARKHIEANAIEMS